jgi:hypothetical protein
MTDDEFKIKVLKINNANDMLKWLLDNEQFLGYDSYFADLRKIMLDKAKQLVENHERINS